MRVLLAGGGTGGHIYPAIAIADAISERDKTAEIAFIGTKKGLENKLVSAAGYPIHHIEVRGLRRRLSFSNLITAYYYFTAPIKAKKLLLDFRPDLVVGTGGYLSWPLLHAAARLKIPTAVHESNAIPGKAVRMLSHEVDRIYTNFAATADRLKEKDKILCVGNPITVPEKEADPAALREALGIPKACKHIVLSFGGSLGAERINAEILHLMRELSAKDPEVFHIHATGKKGYAFALAAAKEYGLCELPNVRILEYIYDMPLWERIADVVICRSGAMTISEMALLGRATILIPSPTVAENHQYENAKRLADAGAAILLEEKYLTETALYESVCGVLHNRRVAKSLSERISAFANPKARDAICEDLIRLAGRDGLSPIKKK